MVQELKQKRFSLKKFKNNLPLHLMMLPAVIICVVFCYIPMYGIVIAFQKFVPSKGLFGAQTWVGPGNFRIVFDNPLMGRIIANTLVISIGKIFLGIVVPVGCALLLNELRGKRFKRSVQTIIYFPYFLSWVVFAGILIDILSPASGIVNQALRSFGVKEIYFLGDPKYFRSVLIVTDVFKTFGFNMIIYLAAISGIDPTLYEAARIDGADRLRQTWHITLPGIKIMIALMSVLSIGNILNAGFEQVWSLLNSAVQEKGEILDTYIYRQGIIARQYGQASAVCLIKSVISLLLIASSNLFCYKVFGYKLF
jgi:putative aldouronate transport system permease protein